jgi:8-oxo-dGTP pyrophosphatase MutT (NUDIX family)
MDVQGIDASGTEDSATEAADGGPPRVQYAALPFRLRSGAVEVLLIHSRETRRWVIPKGWPMRGRKPHRAAQREAYEEAGVVGRIGKSEIGRYAYPKRLPDGTDVECEVVVFPLPVERRRRRWPEREERGKGRWMRPDEAALSVREPGLSRIILSLRPPPD